MDLLRRLLFGLLAWLGRFDHIGEDPTGERP